MTGEGRPDDTYVQKPGADGAAQTGAPGEVAGELAGEVAGELAGEATAAGEAAPAFEPPGAPLSRYRPPAPPPPLPPPRPAGAVPGYRPPTGRVWAPPAQPATPRQWPAPTTPAPLHMLTPAPLATPRWGWKQSLWGLLLGMGPTVVLYAATYSSTDSVDYSMPEVTVATGFIFLVSSALGYGWDYLAAWLFSTRGLPGKWRAWGFRRPSAAYFWVIPVTLVGAYVVSYVNDLVFHPAEQEIVDAFPPTTGGIVLFAIVAVVMAPLAEELYFRGFVFKGFANSWGWVWGAAASGAVFSLAHMQLTLFLPLFALGFGLAWVYHHTGSLWTSISLHAVFNGIAVLAWALTS